MRDDWQLHFGAIPGVGTVSSFDRFWPDLGEDVEYRETLRKAWPAICRIRALRVYHIHRWRGGEVELVEFESLPEREHGMFVDEQLRWTAVLDHDYHFGMSPPTLAISREYFGPVPWRDDGETDWYRAL